MENTTIRKQFDHAVEQHANELDAINSLAKKTNTSITSDMVVKYTLDEIIAAIRPDLALIFLREGDILAHAGELSNVFLYDQTPLHRIGECLWKSVVSQGKMFHSSDLAEDLRYTLEECKQVGVESFAGIPLYAMGEIIGVLGIASQTPRDFGVQAKFLETFAAQASTSLHNALLFIQVHEEISNKKKAEMQLEIYRLQLEDIINLRTKELSQRNLALEKEVADRMQAELSEREQRTLAEALIDASAIVSSTLDLDDVLDRILINLEHVVPHDSATVMLIGKDKDVAYIARYKGRFQRQPTDTAPRSRFVIRKTPTFHKMEESKQPLIISNVEEDPDWIDLEGSGWIKSYVGAPIILGDEVIGYLNLVSAKPYFFTSTHAVRLRAFANHASITIQNARAYDQARQLAILEERQRLARDMHDVVSQTLFTASVVAEALPLQWERNPEKGRQGLDRLRRLTKGALAEMRTLLIELRPDALIKADLGDLITQIAEGATSRAEFDISVSIGDQGPLPPDVQTELFRIVQEIFNNIIKHARASKVIVKYNNSQDGVFIHVSDNGRGFNPDETQEDRFGLRIMRERTETIGAELKITSQPGQGTIVEVEWLVD